MKKMIFFFSTSCKCSCSDWHKWHSIDIRLWEWPHWRCCGTPEKWVWSGKWISGSKKCQNWWGRWSACVIDVLEHTVRVQISLGYISWKENCENMHVEFCSLTHIKVCWSWFLASWPWKEEKKRIVDFIRRFLEAVCFIFVVMISISLYSQSCLSYWVQISKLFWAMES